MAKNIQYFVEGECEEKLIFELKKIGLVLPGKIHVFNPKEERFYPMHLYPLKPNTTIILVFDTDTDNTKILKENIDFLKSHKQIVKDVICMPQVRNLEDELIRSTDIKNIKELLGSKSEKDFKRDFCSTTNLMAKLNEHSFDIKKMWVTKADEKYEKLYIKRSTIYKTR